MSESGSRNLGWWQGDGMVVVEWKKMNFGIDQGHESKIRRSWVVGLWSVNGGWLMVDARAARKKGVLLYCTSTYVGIFFPQKHNKNYCTIVLSVNRHGKAREVVP